MLNDNDDNDDNDNDGRPGDLLEFQREAYQHWAVYIGDHARVIEVGKNDNRLTSND